MSLPSVGDLDGDSAEGALVHVFDLAGVAAGLDERGCAEGDVGDDGWAWDGKSTLEGGVVCAWGLLASSWMLHDECGTHPNPKGYTALLYHW
jgi:hypothetical protein